MSKECQNDEDVQELLWQVKYSRAQTNAAGELALRALLGFAFIVVFMILFLEGFPWHAYWNSFGRYLLLASSCPFILLVYCVGQFAIRWQLMRDFQKELKHLLEDRYEITGIEAAELGVKE